MAQFVTLPSGMQLRPETSHSNGATDLLFDAHKRKTLERGREAILHGAPVETASEISAMRGRKCHAASPVGLTKTFTIARKVYFRRISA